MDRCREGHLKIRTSGKDICFKAKAILVAVSCFSLLANLASTRLIASVATIGRIVILMLAAGMCALVQGLIMGPADLAEKSDGWGIDLGLTQQGQPVLWVDARSRSAYEELHYPGALHLSEDDWDEGLGDLLVEWDPEVRVVVYCDGLYCANSREIAARLRTELGQSEVYWLIGGWDVLKEELAR